MKNTPPFLVADPVPPLPGGQGAIFADLHWKRTRIYLFLENYGSVPEGGEAPSATPESATEVSIDSKSKEEEGEGN